MKKIISMLLALGIMLSMVACSSKPADTPPAEAETKGNTVVDAPKEDSNLTGTCQDNGCVWDPYTPMKETVTFTKGVTAPSGNENYNEGDNIANNPITRYVEQTVNVKTAVAWETAQNNYDQKISLSIAAKDIPDVMLVNRQIFEQLVENDLIMDLTEVYDKCISDYVRERLDSFGPRLMDQVYVDGKMMAIPGTQIAGQHSVLWVRQDWLDALGLPMPETLDDVVATAKAFVENDMSGTGNTVGLMMHENVISGYNLRDSFETVFSNFGAYPRAWVERDGKMVYGSTLPENKAALEFVRQMYADGLIDKEFAVHKDGDRKEILCSNRCGLAFMTWAGGSHLPDCIRNNPEAEWTVCAAPVAGDGKLHVVSHDPVNQFLVIRKGFEHPEAIVKALNASCTAVPGFEKERQAAHEEAPDMIWYCCPIPLQIGYEDELAKCIVKLDEADKTGVVDESVSAMYECVVYDREHHKEDPPKWREALIRTQGMAAATSAVTEVEPVPFFGITETMSKKWTNLMDLEIDMMLKIIMGEKPVDEFDQFVETWYKMGGDKITEEVQAAVDAHGVK